MTSLRTFINTGQGQRLNVGTTFRLITRQLRHHSHVIRIIRHVNYNKSRARSSLTLQSRQVSRSQTRGAIILTRVSSRIHHFKSATLRGSKNCKQINRTSLRSIFLRTILRHTSSLPRLLLVFKVITSRLRALRHTRSRQRQRQLNMRLQARIMARRIRRPTKATSRYTSANRQLNRDIRRRIRTINRTRVQDHATTTLTRHARTIHIIRRRARLRVLLRHRSLIRFTRVTLRTRSAFNGRRRTTLLLLNRIHNVLRLRARQVRIIISMRRALTLIRARAISGTNVHLNIMSGRITQHRRTISGQSRTLVARIRRRDILLTSRLNRLTFRLFIVGNLATRRANTRQNHRARFNYTFNINLTRLEVIYRARMIIRAPIRRLFTPRGRIKASLTLRFKRHRVSINMQRMLASESTYVFFGTYGGVGRGMCGLVLISIPSTRGCGGAFLTVGVDHFLFNANARLCLFARMWGRGEPLSTTPRQFSTPPISHVSSRHRNTITHSINHHTRAIRNSVNNSRRSNRHFIRSRRQLRRSRHNRSHPTQRPQDHSRHRNRRRSRSRRHSNQRLRSNSRQRNRHTNSSLRRQAKRISHHTRQRSRQHSFKPRTRFRNLHRHRKSHNNQELHSRHHSMDHGRHTRRP